MGIVIDPPPRHEALQVGAERLQLQPADKAGQVIGMGADVADAAAGAGARRVGAPFGLFRPGGLQRLGQPVLRIFHLHHPQLAQFARRHHLARLAHHRIAGIVMGQDEQRLRALRRLQHPLGLGQRRGQRLVTDHVDAAFQEFPRRRVMHVVGGDDRHRLDPLFQPRLALRHGGKIVIDPVRVQPQIGARSL